MKFVKMVQVFPALANSPEDSTTAVMSTFSYIKISTYLDPRTPEKIRTQRESGLGFLIFFKDYLYIYTRINKKCKEQTFMFKLYSKIKYIFPLAAGDNWQVKSLREPSPSPSLQRTYYSKGSTYEKQSVRNTSGHTDRQLLGVLESSLFCVFNLT